MNSLKVSHLELAMVFINFELSPLLKLSTFLASVFTNFDGKYDTLDTFG
jgi:hypothetical protein